MHLLFDTETSGLPRKEILPSSPYAARIVQIAMLVLDEGLNEVSSFKCLVQQQDHVIFNEGATAIHGITKEQCYKYGLPIEDVLDVWKSYHTKAKVVIAHNLQFDWDRIQEEEALAFGFPRTLSMGNPVCTMLAMTNICKLPSKFNGKYKWPKLQEAYEFLFNEKFDKAHDAMADIRACARIYKYLVISQNSQG